MVNKDIIDINYFNVNEKKNSILENAKYQDNEINAGLDKMDKLTEEIKDKFLNNSSIDNVDTSIDFSKKK